MSYAEKVCDKDKYSIIFINGMLNSRDDYRNSLKQLEKALRIGGVKVGDGGNVIVRGAFNPSHLAGLGDSLKVLIQKTYDQKGGEMNLDYDAKEMLTSLSKEVKEGRILFVPHSQGNFYANILSNWIVTNPKGLQPESMTMYNVASPAQYSFHNAKYILSKNDKIISGLVGSVGSIAPPNVSFKYDESDPNGHNFVNIYLKHGGDKIVKEIKEQLSILKASNNKTANNPCIPKPENSFLDKLEKIAFTIADPVATTLAAVVEKAPTPGMANVLQVYEKAKDIEKVIENKKLANKIEETKNKNQDISTPNNQKDLKREESSITTQKIFDDKNEAIKKLLDEKNIELVKAKDLVLNANKSGGGAHSSNIITEIVSTSSTITIQNNSSSTDSSSTPPISNSTTTSSTTPVEIKDNSSSTPSNPDIEDLYNKEKLSLENAVLPSFNNNNLKITEYYIGQDNEATWLEITNLNSEKYIDTRDTYIMDGDIKIPFPVNAIPPNKMVIINDGGEMIHHYNATGSKVYKAYTILKKIHRDYGTFELILSAVNNERLLIEYGRNTCSSSYRYKRSCELNLINDSWSLALDPDNAEERNIVSSIGDDNYISRFTCYEDTFNLRHLDDSKKYIYGNCDIPVGLFGSMSDISSVVFIKTDKDYYDGYIKSKLLAGHRIYFEYGDRQPRFSVKIIDNKYFFPDDMGPVFPYQSSEESSSTASSTQVKGFDENGCFNGNFEDATTIEARYATCGNGWNKRIGSNDLTGFRNSESRTPEDGRLVIDRYQINSGNNSWITLKPAISGVVQFNNLDVVINGKRYPVPNKSTYNGEVVKISDTLPEKGNIKVIYANNIFEIPRIVYKMNYDYTNSVDPGGLVSVTNKIYKFADPSDGYYIN